MTALDAGPDRLGLAEDDLRAEYSAYCAREARALVFMLPEQAVRPLLRRAWRDRPDASRDDPLGTLADVCRGLLPLPPFEVWREDRSAHPDGHLAALDDSSAAPSPSEPATLSTRAFAALGETWTARLRAYRDADAWRGFIHFESGPDGPSPRTSVVFREVGPEAVRDRFESFGSVALESFLRSALP